jgi:hypothetical protein
LVEAGKLSIARVVAKSREHFPFGVSGSDGSKILSKRLPVSIFQSPKSSSSSSKSTRISSKNRGA